jgi:hypothetical protein
MLASPGRGTVWGVPCEKQRKQFFFEKKNQKTFATLVRSLAPPIEADFARHYTPTQ